MAIAERVDGDTRQRVEVLFAGIVPQPDAFAAHEGHRLAGVGVHHMGHCASLLKRETTTSYRRAVSAVSASRARGCCGSRRMKSSKPAVARARSPSAARDSAAPKRAFAASRLDGFC